MNLRNIPVIGDIVYLFYGGIGDIFEFFYYNTPNIEEIKKNPLKILLWGLLILYIILFFIYSFLVLLVILTFINYWDIYWHIFIMYLVLISFLDKINLMPNILVKGLFILLEEISYRLENNTENCKENILYKDKLVVTDFYSLNRKIEEKKDYIDSEIKNIEEQKVSEIISQEKYKSLKLYNSFEILKRKYEWGWCDLRDEFKLGLIKDILFLIWVGLIIFMEFILLNIININLNDYLDFLFPNTVNFVYLVVYLVLAILLLIICFFPIFYMGLKWIKLGYNLPYDIYDLIESFRLNITVKEYKEKIDSLEKELNEIKHNKDIKILKDNSLFKLLEEIGKIKIEKSSI